MGENGNMDIAHINPFIVAMTQVLQEQASVTPRRSNLGLKQGNVPAHDVSGFVGISGSAYGSVILSFPRQTALRLVGKMCGEELSSNENVAEGVCELAKLVAARARDILAESGIKAFMSIPRAVIGNCHYIHMPKKVPCVEIEFESELGRFTLEVALKVLNGAGVAS